MYHLLNGLNKDWFLPMKPGWWDAPIAFWNDNNSNNMFNLLFCHFECLLQIQMKKCPYCPQWCINISNSQVMEDGRPSYCKSLKWGMHIKVKFAVLIYFYIYHKSCNYWQTRIIADQVGKIELSQFMDYAWVSTIL